MNIQTKTMKTQENTHPIQMGNNGITVTNDTIQKVVIVCGWTVVAHHKNSRMSARADNTKSTNPYMVRKQRKLRWIINSNIRIRRHGIHVMSNDNGKRTNHRQVNRQLGMPRRG